MSVVQYINIYDLYALERNEPVGAPGIGIVNITNVGIQTAPCPGLTQASVFLS